MLLIITKSILFLFWVNLLPPLARLLFGERFGWRLDGGLCFFDKEPLLGSHKTIRGVVVSVLGAAAIAPLVGLSWHIAAFAGLLAMAGDLLSSFIKRRLHKPAGSALFGLDQLFEGLFPLLLLRNYFFLTWGHFFLLLLLFIPLAYGGSTLWQYISSRPHYDNYCRFVRSTVRFRQWRCSHEPLPRWQAFFNLTNFLSHQVVLSSFFKLTGLYPRGVANALDMGIEEQTFHLQNLPIAFDELKILLLTDLHLDGLEDLTARIITCLQETEVDLCLIGGDIRMKNHGSIAPSIRHLRVLVPEIRARQGVYGVLGNHDCLEMAPDFEEAGITMLINDAWPINKGKERIWLVGIDDPHYYKTHNLPQAFRDILPGEGVIFLAHSPEAYKEAARHGAALYLCGHTHGGQIRLPGSGPLLTNSRAPRFTASGRWQYERMAGYTSRGVGCSGIPLRFNCPAEMTLITLRRAGNDLSSSRE
ncbi:MAG: CDP-archaeol synthase [Desulfurivibrionaceae bacterium]|nr:CDP-archaeol synthase [Desulfurivibrionaceae bacterium]